MKNKKIILFAALAVVVIIAVLAFLFLKSAPSPVVKFQTNMGDITVQLNQARAPKTVKNFLRYVDSDFYVGTQFHRVIPGFMIQGGGFTANFEKKRTQAPILNEANNGLKNKRGTIAMARTFDPHSATAQFFINSVDNAFLDHKSATPDGWGYTVFGEVIEGMDVVDKISALPTGAGGPFQKDVPLETVVINKVIRIQ